MEEYAAFCSVCNQITEVVFDKSSGDTVCSECGLVLESRSIDDTAEWRSYVYAYESDDIRTFALEPNRVGGASNSLLLTRGGLSTVLNSKPNGDIDGDFVKKWQNQGSNPDRTLIQALITITDMCDRLGLLATIKDRANEIYNKVEDIKSRRCRNQDALLAACLYIACRQEKKPRTVKEICSVANGASWKEIAREKNYIIKQLELAVEMGIIHANDFMRRFCFALGMTKEAIKAAEEAVHKSEKFDIRRSPISIAAAVIYIISQLSDDKKFFPDISFATGACESSIQNAYNDLHPHLSKIVPNWYAKDLRNLSNPSKISHKDNMD